MTLTVQTDRRQKVAAAAYRMRHHALNMGEAQGQGYVGQALGAADMLAGVYADQLRYRADDPHWDGRDRFLLSTGHYAIGLYAALAEAGIIDVERARHLRFRRLTAADVRNGQLHTGNGDLRRLAGPRSDRRGRHGAGAAPPGIRPRGSSTSCPTASSTRARRGRPRWAPAITGSAT